MAIKVIYVVDSYFMVALITKYNKFKMDFHNE